MKVPKIIHRIWLGPAPEPDYSVAFTEHWRALNPGFIVATWRDLFDYFVADVAGFPHIELEVGDLVLGDLHRAAWPTQAHRADLLRLELVYRFGGIYADADMEPLRPIEPLYAESPYLAFCTPDAEDWPGGALFGGQARHPAIRGLLDAIPDRVADMGINARPHHLLGPYLWRDHLDIAGPQCMDVIGTTATAYPVHYRDRDLLTNPDRAAELAEATAGSYAVHHFAGSWLKR